MLERLGYEVTTYDVNENLHPSRVVDISAEEIPEEDIKRYGCVICAEVLEHIPFEKFTKCISNIEKTCTGKVILTVPDAFVKKQMQLTFGGRTLHSKIFRLYVRKSIADIHFWELNYQKEYKYENVRRLIGEKLKIIREGDIRNNLYHHYYICDVRK